MKQLIKLSIIIVEYHSGKYLQTLLQTLPKRKDWEVIVVNNEKENRGYGGGLNEGTRKAKGEYLLFLNPDVRIDEKAIESLIKYLSSHANIGVVGPKFINAEGKTEQCSTQFPTLLRSLIAFSPLHTLFPNNVISKNYWMTGWNRESTREVDVVSGAAMMVRAIEFKKIGEFDESMFLYWEEFDLCARYKKVLQLGAAYVSTAIAHHPREVSMKKSNKNLHDIFVNSRKMYFKKHLGLMSMVVIETWLSVYEQWRYLAVGLLALFLRVWNIDRINFIGDVGRDYLEAVHMIRLDSIPLMGIPSSIPRFLQGPFNVWFSALSFILGGIHPFSPVLFSAVLTTLGVIVLMRLVSQQYGKNAGYIAGLLSATMMSGVMQSRMPFYLFAIPLFLSIHIMLLIKMKATWSSVFLAVLSFWLTFQWEMAVLPLIIPLVVFMWMNQLAWKKKVFAGATASILGLLPQIIYDVTHQCSQLCGLGMWAVYRVVAFSGFDGKHGIGTLSFTKVAMQISEQFNKLFGFGIYSGIFVLVLALLTCMFIFINVKKKRDNLAIYAMVSFVVLLLSIIIHGSPSEAYFPPFLVLIPILCGYIISKLPGTGIRLTILGATIFAIISSVQLISNNFYTKPIRAMLDVAQWIAQDSHSNSIQLYSYDDPAHIPTYLDHMKFLVQMYGGNISENGVRYVVALDERVLLPSVNIVQQTFGYIRVVRALSTR